MKKISLLTKLLLSSCFFSQSFASDTTTHTGWELTLTPFHSERIVLDDKFQLGVTLGYQLHPGFKIEGGFENFSSYQMSHVAVSASYGSSSRFFNPYVSFGVASYKKTYRNVWMYDEGEGYVNVESDARCMHDRCVGTFLAFGNDFNINKHVYVRSDLKLLSVRNATDFNYPIASLGIGYRF